MILIARSEVVFSKCVITEIRVGYIIALCILYQKNQNVLKYVEVLCRLQNIIHKRRYCRKYIFYGCALNRK